MTMRLSSERCDARDFVDALRVCLGLDPLYAVEKKPIYAEQYLGYGQRPDGRKSNTATT